MTATRERPNVILITTDQQRWDCLAINDPSTNLQTPNLDALAASGVNFRRAYSSCPVCIPARRSLLSGLHPTTHGLRWYADGLEWDAPFSLPGELAHNGWQTQLVGKLHLHPQRKRYGYEHMVRCESSNDRWDTPLQPVNDWVDAMKAKGIEHPNCIGINGNGRIARPWTMGEELHYTSWLTQQAVDFVAKTRDLSCPFFLHLSYPAPHPPLTPPQYYWDRYVNRHTRPRRLADWTPKMDGPRRGISDDSRVGPFTDREIHEAVAGYYGLINHIDDQVRYFMTRMFEYGSPRAKEPSVIIFTSDHGEMLGDYQLWRKSLPYDSSARIPFFITAKNMDFIRGVQCDDLVGLEDVAATVLDLCGLEQPKIFGNDLDSISLAGHLRGRVGRRRERFFGECKGVDHHFTICGNQKYIRFTKTGEEQLFDISSDPFELHDLSADESLLPTHRDAFKKHCMATGITEDLTAGFTPCRNAPPRAVYS